jgi:2-phosphosulfolactate phosphatase
MVAAFRHPERKRPVRHPIRPLCCTRCRHALGSFIAVKSEVDKTLAFMAAANHPSGRPGDRRAVQRLILAGGEVRRFHDPSRPHLHPEDVDIALDIDRYDFAVRVEYEDGRPVARIEKPA